MDLNERDIQEFSQLWEEEFVETLSPHEARHYASQLLELYLVLAPPPPEQPEEPNKGSADSHKP